MYNSTVYLFTAFILLIISAFIGPLLSGRKKLSGWFNFFFLLSSGILMLIISFSIIFRNSGTFFKSVDAGFTSLHFLIDPLSAFFICIISFMGIVSAFYSIDYMNHYKDYPVRSYYLNFPLFILGMLGIVTIDDLSWGFSLSWQLMTISSFFLIKFENRIRDNVRKAKKYLALMEMAWVLIIAGTFFIGGFEPGDPVHILTEKISGISGLRLYAVFGLLLIGFGFKAGVFPLGQLWLPDAHSIAPSPVSSLLSGVMIKTGAYGILRTAFWMLPGGSYKIWGIIIASFGVISMFIGTIQSMKQSDAKRLLAYSSLGQIGYVIFGTGAGLFAFSNSEQFMQFLSIILVAGVLFHIINHAVFKGLLFLTSGSILYATGTKDLNRLGGLAKLMPLTALAAGIASLSISGIPPFSGFASKWTLISSSLLAGSNSVFLGLFAVVALFTSAITLACYVKYFGMTFTSAGAKWHSTGQIKEVPGKMLISKLALSALCLLQGILPFIFFKTIISILSKSEGSLISVFLNDNIIYENIKVSFTGIIIQGKNIILSSAAPLIILIILIIAVVIAQLLKKSAGSEEKESDVWLCGYQDLNSSNIYKEKNMFSALKGLFRWTGGKL